jgi:hypothetical protein
VLLRWWTHPWPHGDCVILGVVEGWSCRGVAATATIAGVAVIVTNALALVVAAIVGVGSKRMRAR